MFNANTGLLILRRARYELKSNNDPSLCIVFSAMAVECEVSRLFFRWSRVGQGTQRRRVGDTELEERLRTYRSVKRTLEKTAELMHPAGMRNFIVSRSGISRRIATGFPNLDADRFVPIVVKQLFWPRNRILHLGDTAYDVRAATRAFNVASLTLFVYQELNAKKREDLRRGIGCQTAPCSRPVTRLHLGS